jgi:hypothetical protein
LASFDNFINSRRQLSLRIVVLFVAACIGSACHPPPLPEANSAEAKIYVERCGQCHVPYNPHELTAPMWDLQVPMMEVKIQSAGLPPLSDNDRETILEYLKRNAGTQ